MDAERFTNALCADLTLTWFELEGAIDHDYGAIGLHSHLFEQVVCAVQHPDKPKYSKHVECTRCLKDTFVSDKNVYMKAGALFRTSTIAVDDGIEEYNVKTATWTRL